MNKKDKSTDKKIDRQTAKINTTKKDRQKNNRQKNNKKDRQQTNKKNKQKKLAYFLKSQRIIFLDLKDTYKPMTSPFEQGDVKKIHFLKRQPLSCTLKPSR